MACHASGVRGVGSNQGRKKKVVNSLFFSVRPTRMCVSISIEKGVSRTARALPRNLTIFFSQLDYTRSRLRTYIWWTPANTRRGHREQCVLSLRNNNCNIWILNCLIDAQWHISVRLYSIEPRTIPTDGGNPTKTSCKRRQEWTGRRRLAGRSADRPSAVVRGVTSPNMVCVRHTAIIILIMLSAVFETSYLRAAIKYVIASAAHSFLVRTYICRPQTASHTHTSVVSRLLRLQHSYYNVLCFRYSNNVWIVFLKPLYNVPTTSFVRPFVVNLIIATFATQKNRLRQSCTPVPTCVVSVLQTNYNKYICVQQNQFSVVSFNIRVIE